ncbi:MAG: N-acetyltransferase family protein [Sphingobacteriales bacterium]|jgi:L-amino acid N-acyltransferase YncA|nr:N-acetyltransferase family protein [Sphingobacteriales bacterium]
MITIRPAEERDVEAITAIYNEAVLNTTATFDTDPKTETDRLSWLRAHGEQHPVLVAIVDNTVAGWASLSRWSERAAYDSTAETSLYVHVDYRKRGIGKQLMEVLVLAGRKAGLHTLIARITHGNEQSIYLHERMGFVNIGTMREAGTKFGRYHDVHFLQIVFS